MTKPPNPDPGQEPRIWHVTFTRSVAVNVRAPDPQQAIMYAEHRIEKDNRHTIEKITVRELTHVEAAQ